MPPEVLKKFQDLAKLGQYCPPGIDWKQSIQEVRALVEPIEQILNVSLYLDDQVQDASYFVEICIDEYPSAVSPRAIHQLILFSAFGRMVVVLNRGCEKANRTVRWDMVPQVIELLVDRGFDVIPPEYLDEDGGVWWSRFFSYQ